MDIQTSTDSGVITLAINGQVQSRLDQLPLPHRRKVVEFIRSKQQQAGHDIAELLNDEEKLFQFLDPQLAPTASTGHLGYSQEIG